MHDYVGGKEDWAVHRLPLEGRTAERRRALDLAREDIPTCGSRERLGDVHERVQAAGHEMCIVVNDAGVVLGRLLDEAWEDDPVSVVEDVMQLGPPTTRPGDLLHEIIERLRKGDLEGILVTSYGTDEVGGRLIGVLFRADVERVLAENERLP